ncbi:MAG TPA: response regulator [Thermoanaerobaculia bacterium]|jgi:DNA-binding response OmpR family regulator|nr:response regulator [Thermoanaerobaculia bacterium]
MRPKALIVEDDPNTQRLLSAIIEAEGLDVEVANDGDVAIDLLSRESYAVILLDIVLPTVSGTAVMEYLRANNPAALANVIVVTGLDVAEVRTLFPTVRQALGKPVLPARLRATVRTCIPGWGSSSPDMSVA